MKQAGRQQDQTQSEGDDMINTTRREFLKYSGALGTALGTAPAFPPSRAPRSR